MLIIVRIVHNRASQWGDLIPSFRQLPPFRFLYSEFFDTCVNRHSN